MTDLLRLFVEIARFIWPFRIVHQWERAGYYVCGHWWRECGPGLKPVIPWFCDVMSVSIAPALVGTGREDVTLSDGSILSYSAMATLRVVDVRCALNDVDDYHESTQELIRSFISEQFALVDTARLQPDKRKAYIKKLQTDLAEEAASFGVEISKLRFPSFVLNVRAFRLLMDQEAPAHW